MTFQASRLGNGINFVGKRFYNLFSNRREVHKAILWSLIIFWLFFLIKITLIPRIAIDLQEHRCLPWKIYWINPGRPPIEAIHRGDLLKFMPGVLMHVPGIPDNKQPFEHGSVIKMVAAVPGDRVVITTEDIQINGRSIADITKETLGIDVKQRYIHPITSAKLGKKPEDYVRSFAVPDGTLFMIGTEERTFDSRYWGVLPIEKVTGRAYGFWKTKQ